MVNILAVVDTDFGKLCRSPSESDEFDNEYEKDTQEAQGKSVWLKTCQLGC